ncbi:hypothetical protein ABEW32_10525 [Paenibacillus jamilae]
MESLIGYYRHVTYLKYRPASKSFFKLLRDQGGSQNDHNKDI